MGYLNATVLTTAVWVVNLYVAHSCPLVCRCQSNGYVYCDGKSLTEIPPNIPHDTVYLYLINNNLTSIPAGSFQELPMLEVLYLSNNNIDYVSNDAFRGLDKLKGLYLNNNQIKDFPWHVLSVLRSLTGFEIQYNILETLPIISNLPNMTEMYFHNNNITDIGGFHNLPELDALTLPNNNISSLPDNVFDGLPNLRKLYLGNNDIDSIQSNVFNSLTNLQELHLDNNILSEPPNITLLHELRYLFLSHNNIHDITESFFSGVSNIYGLDLSYNQLTMIPPFNNPAVWRIGSYEIFVILNHNLIESIGPHAFQGFNDASVRYLYLYMTDNKILDVDEIAFDGLHSRNVYIHLDRNNLTTLPSLTISQVRNNYIRLYVSGNPWSCDCRLSAFKRWLEESSRPVYVYDMICQYPETYFGMNAMNIPAENMTCSLPTFNDLLVQWVSIDEGEQVELDCEAEGIPQPNIYWVTPNGNATIPDDDITNTLDSTQIVYSSLKINKVETRHQGTYVCVATNAAGSTIAMRYLQVGLQQTDENQEIDITTMEEQVDNHTVPTIVITTLEEKVDNHTVPTIVILCRLCKICNSTLVEDEKHFILQCPLYNLLRHDLFSEAAKHINNYRNLTEEQQFKEIMSNKTLIIALGKYIKLSNIKREHHLQNTHNI